MSVQSTCPVTKGGFTLTASNTNVYHITAFVPSDKCLTNSDRIFCYYVLSTWSITNTLSNPRRMKILFCHWS